MSVAWRGSGKSCLTNELLTITESEQWLVPASTFDGSECAPNQGNPAMPKPKAKAIREANDTGHGTERICDARMEGAKSGLLGENVDDNLR